MAGIVHHSGGHDGEDSRGAAILRAILTVLLVTIVVAGALGAATYVVSRALVHLMS